MPSHHESEPSVLLDFVEQLLDDLDGGKLRPFEEYRARFPGHDEALAREYERIVRDPELSPPSAAESALLAPDAAAPEADTSELLERLSRRAHATRYGRSVEISRGGMGVIAKVWDEDLRRYVAMKTVLGIGQKTVDQFIEEAQVTGGLDHPGIVPVHELGVDAKDRAFFTMRLVRGRNLKKIFELVHAGAEGWTRTRALHVILRVCEAMAYAHARGVIHRDIKPSNVMVGGFGEVYVMDWGLARVMGRPDRHDLRLRDADASRLDSLRTRRREERETSPDSPLITMDGDVVGTPSYMAPEQAQGRIDELGPHTDVYQVGTLLYQLLTGAAPYIGRSDRVSPRTVLAMVLHGPPASVSSLAPDVPGELVAICERAMARAPADRYATTMAMAADLEAYLDGRVVATYETGAAAELRKWVARNKGLSLAVATACAAVVLGLAGVYLAERKHRRAMDSANRELASTNDALRVAKTTAEDNERTAMDNARTAALRAADVLSLSAIQDLNDLIARADALWPAHPTNIPLYEGWLREADALIAGRPADDARGVPALPGLAGHKERLDSLRARALPASDAPDGTARETHPRAEELATKAQRLAWMSRMLGEPSSVPTAPAPDDRGDVAPAPDSASESSLTTEAMLLNHRAWELVNPKRESFGREAWALEIAQRALALADHGEEAEIHDTTAWALLANARFEEALDEQRRGLEAALPEKRIRFERSRTRLVAAVDSWTKEPGRSKHAEEREALGREVTELERDVRSSRAWTFASRDDQWWHEQLSKLIGELERFADPDPMIGLRANVAHRLDVAREIDERASRNSDAATRWSEAVASIGNRTECPAYGGLALAPQQGLLPLGRDPGSGLWEFAHLLSGEIPERGPEGTWSLTRATGLVLVLIPGGRFAMGAQSTDASAANYDPMAIKSESPVHTIELAPFFASKYEMTQAQWLRVAATNPSVYNPKRSTPEWNVLARPIDLVHPVEHVSWEDCTRTLFKLGLALPTEAQWEYAARAGTHGPWWTGSTVASLRNAANLGDEYAKRHGFELWPLWEESLDDGFTMHAPVDFGRANPFGLFNVCGNVREWCDDVPGSYKLPVRAGDGKRHELAIQLRSVRGGSFAQGAGFARSGAREAASVDARIESIGVRPVRRLDP